MVAPESLALVVRQRGGPNLIVHTRGIPGTLVYRACEEAVTIMGRFAVNRGQTDVDGSGDIHPKFAHDKLLVLNGRYAVVYRLVYKVWVMAVAPVQSSCLVSVRLVEAATKGLVATCQILEVDKDVVARNYQEVHFMMGAILKYQGADLQRAQADALANIYSFIADTREKKGKSGTDSSKRVPNVRAANRKLTDFNGKNQNFDFHLPADFKRLQNPSGMSAPSDFGFDFGSFPVKSAANTAQPQAFKIEDVLPKPVQEAPIAQPATFTGLDDLLGTPNAAPTVPAPVVAVDTSIDLFSAMPPVVAGTVSAQPTTSSWFDFDSVQQPQTLSVTSKSVEVIAPQQSWPLLFLSERWEGTFEGNTCTSSSASGEVGLRKQIWKPSSGKELKFKLTNTSNQSNASRGIALSMKCVRRNADRTSVLKNGIFSAKIKPATAPYLKYSLLPGCYDAPVWVCVTSAMGSFKQETRCLILLIHVWINPKNKSATNGSVFAWLPRPFAPPTYARPQPQFSKKQNCIKWTLREIQPAQNVLFKAVLRTTDSVDDEIANNIRVVLNCIGRPGTTFSGISLTQQLTPGVGPLRDIHGVCIWSATVTARPQLIQT